MSPLFNRVLYVAFMAAIATGAWVLVIRFPA
jgi:hypothetical protein